MVIDFNNMEEKITKEFKGGKGDFINKIYANELGKVIYGRLEPGSTIGLHTHDTSSEAIFILSGKADYIYDDGTETVEAGGCHYCPKGHSHSMINNGPDDLVFFAVVPEQ